jgi:hypothetical protein
VFRRDLQSDTTVLVSTSDDETTRGDGASQLPTISADGSRVAFDSTATDLTSQSGHPDGSVYVRDVSAGTTVLASVNTAGEPANDYSQASRISADGQNVMFGSAATNLSEEEDAHNFLRLLDEGATYPPMRYDVGWGQVAMNADATIFAFVSSAPLITEGQEPWEDTDPDLYVYNDDGSGLRVVDLHQLDDPSRPQLSADGRFVGAYGDTTEVALHVYDLADNDNFTPQESVRSDGTAVTPSHPAGRFMSDDGRFVVFDSNTGDVTSDDLDGRYDVFVHDRLTPTQDATGTGSTTTDSGSGPTLGDPMVVSVTGAPGAVVIDERSPQEADPPTGYSVLGQPVHVTADPPTPPAFLTLTFEVDATAVPSGSASAAEVLREGVVLSDCTGGADPGPCVASRSVLASGDWRFVAHSPQASTWVVATPIGAGPPPKDATNPTVALRTPADGEVYDVGEQVTVDYDCADTGGAGVLSCVGERADGAALDTSSPGTHLFTVVATDNAGNDASVTHAYEVEAAGDAVPPTITLSRPVEGASYTLGSVVTASYSCADTGGSDVASCVGSRASGANLPTGSIGTRTFTVTATDNAGNSATTTVSYRIVWPLTAFLAPVDNPPVVNTVRAGRIVPVRFSLGGNRGGSVFAQGYPRVTTVACPGGAPSDEIETTLGGKPPTLSYANGTYTYALRTQSSWASRTTCRVLTVRWADGQQRSAVFKLR